MLTFDCAEGGDGFPLESFALLDHLIHGLHPILVHLHTITEVETHRETGTEE